MSKLTYRNSRGDLVDVPTVTAAKVRNELGAILDRVASVGATAITRHNTPKAVLLSYDEFEALVQARSNTLDELGGQFDALLARMQTPKARKGVKTAFNASQDQLGRAAVKAARKRR